MKQRHGRDEDDEEIRNLNCVQIIETYNYPPF